MTTNFNKGGFLKKLFALPVLTAALFVFSCTSNAQTHNEGSGHDKDGRNHGKEVRGHDKDDNETRGAHTRDRKGGPGEEDGTELSINDTYNVTKRGVKLVLKYDKRSNSFKGYMKNTTNKSIKKARVEIHLSNNTELGPTKPVTLKPYATKNVVLKATKKSFNGWTTHVEVGGSEHGGKEGGEGGEGHGKREGKERHGSEGGEGGEN
ncbi:hypothetical protein [Pseudotenacibaculum haliotis]|uniref:Lipoprotein n=1 Tax=Pseudotenacibaculum haliotis TaxID=1862138 RepID=A0ABW5LTL1_9FLAO